VIVVKNLVIAIPETLSRYWLWWSVQLIALLLLSRAFWMIITEPGAPAPLISATGQAQDLILYTGKTALICLVLSLACTPLARLLGFRKALTVRKSLGLWGVGYALLHTLFFMGGRALLYSGAAWQSILTLIPDMLSPWFLKTPYARYGTMALLLLIPLVLTSNRLSMQWLGKGWKRLHRLVYLAVPLAVYHYWQRAVYLSTIPQGQERAGFTEPLLFLLVVILLLAIRIPTIRRRLSVTRR